MINDINEIVQKLGRGAFLRKKYPTGECDVEILHPDKRSEPVEWKTYHKFRNKDLGECIATPTKNGGGDGMFSGVPGHDEYYYYGLNEKGKMEFYKSQKGKKINEA